MGVRQPRPKARGNTFTVRTRPGGARHQHTVAGLHLAVQYHQQEDGASLGLVLWTLLAVGVVLAVRRNPSVLKSWRGWVIIGNRANPFLLGPGVILNCRQGLFRRRFILRGCRHTV
jgi:hypothetical protein